ncbi:MAG: serine hydrolase [Saprospiraceae bacterium]|jgi:CubicO group peptidase (beta-lactamase class C family)|nr:serine hydrolase [Saprospiraceae bacterium]
MKTVFFSLFCLLCSSVVLSQTYFPPNNAQTWSTTDPSTLGWCQTKIDSLYRFLESNDTKAFILLKDGKIVLEKYMNGHTVSSNWYWASAGKTLTAPLVGIAQQENLLKISEPSSKYLGKGWTSCTPEQEDKITIRHQLTMSSGLDDGVADPFCTLSSCLKYKADAGNRWAYHNGPYTLLDGVIEKATGKSLNLYLNQNIKPVTGMDGLFVKQGYNNVYFSTARSMARFGLLILNKGIWDKTSVLTDQQYYDAMVNTSQNINLSYGYLWWLNGKNSYMVPGAQIKIPGSLHPNAPNDMFSALGKNGQFINVIPSQKIVMIRMGDNPDSALVPFLFNNDIWKYINNLSCTSSLDKPSIHKSTAFKLIENPVSQILQIVKDEVDQDMVSIAIFDIAGKQILQNEYYGSNISINVENIKSGLYFAFLKTKSGLHNLKFIKH